MLLQSKIYTQRLWSLVLDEIAHGYVHSLHMGWSQRYIHTCTMYALTQKCKCGFIIIVYYYSVFFVIGVPYIMYSVFFFLLCRPHQLSEMSSAHSNIFSVTHTAHVEWLRQLVCLERRECVRSMLTWV